MLCDLIIKQDILVQNGRFFLPTRFWRVIDTFSACVWGNVNINPLFPITCTHVSEYYDFYIWTCLDIKYNLFQMKYYRINASADMSTSLSLLCVYMKSARTVKNTRSPQITNVQVCSNWGATPFFLGIMGNFVWFLIKSKKIFYKTTGQILRSFDLWGALRV